MALSPVPAKKVKKAGPVSAIVLILGGIYAVEGGYVNDRNDPGGATNYGVTEKVARSAGYAGDMRYFPKRCTDATPTCADEIYTRDYIAAPGYMPMVTVAPAVADKLANTAVNMGMARPNKWFRQSLSLPANGGPLGRSDYAAYQALENKVGDVVACQRVLVTFSAAQESEYNRLIRINRKLAKFRNGWIARARDLHPSGIGCEVQP